MVELGDTDGESDQVLLGSCFDDTRNHLGNNSIFSPARGDLDRNRHNNRQISIGRNNNELEVVKESASSDVKSKSTMGRNEHSSWQRQDLLD